MADISNTFIKGIMNKDLDERLVPQGSYRDAQNIEVDTSDGSSVGSASNKMGNTIASNIQDISGQNADTARTIGSITYEAKNLIYWFVAADTFDGIYEYNGDTGESRRILQSNKSTPTTPSKLNFRKEYLITGVNYIPGPNGNNFLYWTDNYNEPRRINITRVGSDTSGLSGYDIDDDRIDNDLSVALEPPIYAPYIKLVDDQTTESEAMKYKFLYLAYRYRYVDGQYSSLSPFSAVSFDPDNYEFDFGVGNNKSMTNKYNSVDIEFETGNEFVEDIQIIVRDTTSINTSIVETYSKSQLGIYSDTSHRVRFKNSKIYSSLPSDQVVRLFDNVPLLAKAQDFIGNRIAYGNYVQFRDMVDVNGDEIKIDFSLSLSTSEVTIGQPEQTWKSDRDYEVGLVYLDDKGRMTTVHTCESNSIYVPKSNHNTSNTIKLRISNNPPDWATHYRIFLKQGQEMYYNIFPSVYYVAGMYRYFRINDHDIDKFKVGDYIIAKNDGTGPLITPKKYKILEAENKPANFLQINTTPELEGFYIKIKVDSQGEFSIGSQLSYEFDEPAIIYSVQSQGGAVVSDTKPYRGFIGYDTDTSGFGIPYVDNPIHYGIGDPNAMYLSSTGGLGANTYEGFSSGSDDYRYYIEIVSQSEFRYTLDKTLSSSWVYAPITPGQIPIQYYGDTLFHISFNTSSTLEVGDRWVVNLRGQGSPTNSNYYGGYGLMQWNNAGAVVTAGLYQNNNYYDYVAQDDIAIQAGATITLQCIQDTSGSPYTSAQTFTSDSTYVNIEEWFNESGAWQQFIAYDSNGVNVGANAVNFRRGLIYNIPTQSGVAPNVKVVYQDYNLNQTESGNFLGYPVHMIIMGYGDQDTGTPNNVVQYKIQIFQTDEQVSFETEALDNEADIYHELETYPVENGLHKVLWDYDDYGFTGDSNVTRLTQLDNRRPHYFSVGDSIYVNHNGSSVVDAEYTIVDIENRYSVIIDFPFPGAGPAEPGTIRFSQSDEQNQINSFTPAIIELNKPYSDNSSFNAWTFGNGVESNRIYDDFNRTTLQFSQRVSTKIDGKYKKVRNEASICYSSLFNENTEYNRLNEFNLATSNFKYLERDYGSIQKLHTRDNDLLVLQENKISRVLFGKNVMYDSVGGGSVVTVPEVLGTQLPLYGEYGISNNPESFANWSGTIFFSDAKRGVVMGLDNDQLSEISMNGMKDYFRDLMRDNPFTQKIGGYDPYNHMYYISTNNQKNIPCSLDISKDELKVPSISAGYILFSIDTDDAWTITLQDTGDGTNWVSDFPEFGTGSQVVYGTVSQNLTGASRSVTFIVEYCDGLTQEFILTQAKGKKGKIIVAVYNNVKN